MRYSGFINGAVLMLLAAQTFLAADGVDPAFAKDDWVYLDNGKVRLGLNKSAGGCIGYFSSSGTNFNLLNSWDRGRFVQQSYYGRKDGTLWAGKAWRWNPVQGGDYKGTPARVLESRFERDKGYTRTLARHWSGCVDLPECVMEQWIVLTGKVAHIRFKMTYTGTEEHPVTHHEIPAVFVNPALSDLVVYEGDRPWTEAPVSQSRPGWPNESRRMTEHWAAFVGTNGMGVGACVPVATNLTCYRYRADSGAKDACSYFAPLIQFAITLGRVFEYDVYLAIGSVNEMRDAFRLLSGHGSAGKANRK